MIYARIEDGKLVRAKRLATPSGTYDAESDEAPSGWYRIESDTEVDETSLSGVPSTISRLRALLELDAAGHLEKVEAAVNQIGGTTKIAYDNAIEFDRNSEFILQMGQLLGMSDEDIDNLFIAASELQLTPR